ncbi:hypothetical protein LTR97_008573 [Elasticomyces elasticus]|uniref:Uncharacterized protein n=1 Tax=Elasticomyces elasticus TaxID=574655 RepID=A0AAN7ZT17_9PEZI|nr:hypothetical protein LTR97_008573 [Elasticomyces elasticus]
MVTIEVNLKDGDKEPEQHLDEGEHIERRVVLLSELYDTLTGMLNPELICYRPTLSIYTALSKEKDTIVDARLYHWALGLHWSQRIFPNKS